MNKVLMPALAIAVATGLGGYGLANYASAQSKPPAEVTDATQPPATPQGWEQHQGGNGGHRWWVMGGWHHSHRNLAFARNGDLFYHQADKKLSTADVQTIAEAMLLRHGNHTWKVTNVAQNQDDTVSFAFATQSGDVIARFAMDERTGHLRRLG